MSTAAIFNKLGQTLIPNALAIALPDTCTITAETTSAGTGGGRIKTGTSNAYSSIPCAYEPLGGARFDSADKLVSTNAYKVTLPTHYSNSGTPTRINLDPKTHKIVVGARGNEPAKTFRIISIADDLGVVFEVVCQKEN